MCLLTPLTVMAEIYKTVDENGNVVFSEIPPTIDAKKYEVSKDNNVKKNVNPDTSSLENQKKYLDYLTQERIERKEKLQEKKMEQAELQAQCNEARAQLEYLNGAGSRYYDVDEQGNRVIVGYEEVEAEMNKYKNFIKRNCHE